ncbi:hypothetical protein QNH10_19635 [Sporosarcina thermotolerans]|nr:hypothetical protein [Sporosarcina thermotolerans]WHT48200.1 hypothetical protein QNH10_19635 [Sporosarcina thermotolerans]
MMDEMKRANRFEQRFMPIEDEILTKLIEVDDAGDKGEVNVFDMRLNR